MHMNEIIDYLLQLVCGEENGESWKQIGYTRNRDEYSSYRVVIQPSSFFEEGIYGTESTLPTLPLRQWEDIPILFGEDTTEMMGNTLVIHADIIAGTYFLISRYEEMVRPTVRDAHGRFPGRESLPYRAGFIDRPIIEK